MPVELTERTLRDAVAVIGEWDHEEAQAVAAALEWMGWEREGPMVLRRYDVQLFVWHTLPRKFLASLEDKRAAAAALARTLERLGGRAAIYAEVCRSRETDQLLCAWEEDGPDAWARFRQLLEGSGIEPPDTDLLEWGRVMGFEEARVRAQVATALEEAIEDGRLSPGAPGFRRRQGQVANAALREPSDRRNGQTRLQMVHAERLERWLRGGRTRGSSERRAIIERVAAAVAADAPSIEPTAASAALGPARWLLDRAIAGIALTQTGALNRALAREVVERFPDWWDTELFGPPNREDEVALLHELHALLRRMRLMRRAGRRIVITTRGRKLRDDPAALLAALAVELLGGKSFTAACAELAGALILDGAVPDYSDALASRIHPAIVAEGWQSTGEHPSQRDVTWGIAEFLRRAESIGLLAREPGPRRQSPSRLVITHAGRIGLTIGLRARALAPADGPC